MRTIRSLLAIAALLSSEAQALQIDSQIALQEEVAKGDSHTMETKDCGGLKDARSIKYCADWNLVVDKANAAIRHCLHSHHHNSEQTTHCIEDVIARRDLDLSVVSKAEASRAERRAQKKLLKGEYRKETGGVDPVKSVQKAAASAAKEAAQKLQAQEKEEERVAKQNKIEAEKERVKQEAADKIKLENRRKKSEEKHKKKADAKAEKRKAAIEAAKKEAAEKKSEWKAEATARAVAQAKVEQTREAAARAIEDAKKKADQVILEAEIKAKEAARAAAIKRREDEAKRIAKIKEEHAKIANNLTAEADKAKELWKSTENKLSTAKKELFQNHRKVMSLQRFSDRLRRRMARKRNGAKKYLAKVAEKVVRRKKHSATAVIKSRPVYLNRPTKRQLKKHGLSGRTTAEREASMSEPRLQTRRLIRHITNEHARRRRSPPVRPYIRSRSETILHRPVQVGFVHPRRTVDLPPLNDGSCKTRRVTRKTKRYIKKALPKI